MGDKPKKKPEENKGKFLKWFLNKWAYNSDNFEQLLRLERESRIAAKNTRNSLDRLEVSTRSLVDALQEVSREIGRHP